MKTVAITGGIGSGKSTICSWLAENGVPVYDSDSRTKSLYDNKLITKIEKAFSQEDNTAISLRLEDGTLDKKKLANIIFNSKEKLELLESIVHPLVLKDFKRWRKSYEGKDWCGFGEVPFVVFESAIVTEKPLFQGIADKIILVEADKDIILQRVQKRDGVDISKIEDRIKNQHFDKNKIDIIIENNSDRKTLIEKTNEVFKSLWASTETKMI